MLEGDHRKVFIMSKPIATPEILDRLLHSLSDTSKRLSNDVEQQAQQIEKRIKKFLDEGEKASDRWVKPIDKDFREQFASLRHEVEQLSHRINEFLGQPAAKPAVKPSATRLPTAKPPIAKKAPAKKAPAKKATARTAPLK